MRGAVPRVEAYRQRPFTRDTFRGPDDGSSFASLIPGEDGYTQAYRLADLTPPQAVLDHHLSAMQAVHDTFHDGQHASMADVQVMVDAYAALRDQLIAAAPSWPATPTGEVDYSAALGRSEPPTPGIQVISASRTSPWNIDYPAPYTESRTSGGWMVYRIPGEPLCVAAHYSFVEPYSGGSFHHASHVQWQYARLQRCP